MTTLKRGGLQRDSFKSAVKTCLMLVPISMFFNKLYRGNVWGMETEDMVIPLPFFDMHPGITKPKDTHGFVGDGDSVAPQDAFTVRRR